MTDASSWLNRTSAWWAKADRAQSHLRSLDRLVAEFRASEPYTVVPRPTDTPGRTEYRLHIHKPMPPEISTTIGDILHNLRSALDSLAYEIALRGLDRPMTTEEERACVFPVTETPERFNQFFSEASRHERTRIRSALNPPSFSSPPSPARPGQRRPAPPSSGNACPQRRRRANEA